MEVQLKPWGNSQGIRLPKSVLKEAGFQPGDTLLAKPENGRIVLYRAVRHKTLEERVRESGCALTGIGELDWGEPQGNEVW